MKAKIYIGIALGLASILFTACSSLLDAVKAREILEDCDYTLKEVNVKSVDFLPAISFNSDAKQFDISNPSIDLLPYLQEIKDGDFKLAAERIKLDALIEIKNPSAYPAILDSMEFDMLLDEKFVTKVSHLERTKIEASTTTQTKVQFELPVNFPIQKLVTAQNIIFNGKVWLKLDVPSVSSFNIGIPFKVRQEAPVDEIKNYVLEHKEECIDKVVTYLTEEAKKEGAKKALNSLFGE